jgi:hypothetical protein
LPGSDGLTHEPIDIIRIFLNSNAKQENDAIAKQEGDAIAKQEGDAIAKQEGDFMTM